MKKPRLASFLEFFLLHMEAHLIVKHLIHPLTEPISNAVIINIIITFRINVSVPLNFGLRIKYYCCLISYPLEDHYYPVLSGYWKTAQEVQWHIPNCLTYCISLLGYYVHLYCGEKHSISHWMYLHNQNSNMEKFSNYDLYIYTPLTRITV